MNNDNNINLVWSCLLNKILGSGEVTYPRGMMTKELLAYQTTIDMNYPIITAKERGMNYKFMCGEAYWILSGSNRVSNITQFMKAIEKFSDNGLMFNGAYGPKVVDQLSYVLSNLKADKDSRQAVINIWRENPRPSKDIPCTLNLQWFIRDNKLHCKANMRSSDAWLGWVYDTFNFSMISAWIALALRPAYNDIRLGNLYLSAGSQHLYENNFEAAELVDHGQICNDIRKGSIAFDINEFGHPDELAKELMFAGLQRWNEVESEFLLQLKDK